VFSRRRGPRTYDASRHAAGDVWYASLAGNHSNHTIAMIDLATGSAIACGRPNAQSWRAAVVVDSSGRIWWVSEWNSGMSSVHDPAQIPGNHGSCRATARAPMRLSMSNGQDKSGSPTLSAKQSALRIPHVTIQRIRSDKSGASPATERPSW